MTVLLHFVHAGKELNNPFFQVFCVPCSLPGSLFVDGHNASDKNDVAVLTALGKVGRGAVGALEWKVDAIMNGGLCSDGCRKPWIELDAV